MYKGVDDPFVFEKYRDLILGMHGYGSYKMCFVLNVKDPRRCAYGVLLRGGNTTDQ